MNNEYDDFKLNKKNKDFEKSNISKMWDIIAQRPNDFDMNVISALKSTVITHVSSSDTLYACYGEKLYLYIRENYLIFKTSNNNNNNNNNKKINLLINDNIFTDKSSNSGNSGKSSNSGISGNNNIDIPPINIINIINGGTGKHIKKADIIREKSILASLDKLLHTMIESFNLVNFTIPSYNVMNSNILEIRAIGFMYMCWFIYNNKDKYTDKIIPFSIIVSLQKFISIIYNDETDTNIISLLNTSGTHSLYNGSNAMNSSSYMNISKTLIDDLKYIEKKLIKLYSFNGITLYEQASELILGSSFDCYLPSNKLAPFAHQKIVSSTIMDLYNLKNGFMMFYRTMTNSGKTSTIINITMAVQELRIKYPSIFGTLQVIATCDVQPVLTRWGQLLYHAGFPFGIGSKREYPSNPESAYNIKLKALNEIRIDKDCIDINMRFSNSDTCKKIEDRLAIICTTEIALKILSKASNANNRFILLHDEPTMYANEANSPQLKTNMNIIKCAPMWSIFSSATLPCDGKSQIFFKNHQTKFPNSKFIDNYSAEIYSCCNVKTFENIPITPHLGCVSRVELINAITNIMSNPFLGKLYTPTSIQLLYYESINVGIKNVEFMKKIPNIIEIFSNIKNLYPDNIRKVALDILNAISLLNDKQIAYICSMDYESDNEDDTEVPPQTNIQTDIQTAIQTNNIDEHNSNIDCARDEHDFTNLGTTDAHKYPYLNLIATSNPMEFMSKNYNNLVINIKKKIGSLNKLESDYEKSNALWHNIYNALEKQYKNADDLTKEQSYMCDIKPSLLFPDECQINTKPHFQKYTTQLSAINYRIPNSLYNFNNININDLHITSDTKLQLLSGVCCYTPPETTDIDSDYLHTALNLTSQKKIETLIADNSICYGTDYPIGGVIITKEFSDKHSLNTIYQLMSRAGRGRKSINSDIYIDISCATQILNTVKQNNTSTLEIDNMINSFNSI